MSMHSSKLWGISHPDFCNAKIINNFEYMQKFTFNIGESGIRIITKKH